MTTIPADGPPLPTRLAILKHMHDLSDEVLCERWAENPYYQAATLVSGADTAKKAPAAKAGPRPPAAGCSVDPIRDPDKRLTALEDRVAVNMVAFEGLNRGLAHSMAGRASYWDDFLLAAGFLLHQ